MSQRSLILGSSSPFRKELLARLGLAFTTAKPEVDEALDTGEPAEELVQRLAIAKAQAIAKQHPNALIIGSDQCAELNGKILGKPHTHENAVKQLSAASGQTVLFHTGLCLLDSANGKQWVDNVPYSVTFRTLSNAQIEDYLQREQPYQCAGSFKSEALGIALFESMQGDDPNALIGLPLIKLCGFLQEAGLSVLADT